MNMLKTLSILAALVWLTMEAQGQDPRFSQYFATPLQNNPAWTGLFGGQFRAIANYRELYTSILDNRPYRTIAASFDARFRSGRNDYWGLGLMAHHDQVGDSRFNRTDGLLSGSYMKKIKGSRFSGAEHFLVAGAQVGVGQQGFDFEQLWFTNQFDENSAQVDFSAPTGEDFTETRSNIYLNVNAGLLWYALLGEQANFYLGGSVNNINQPSVSLIENSESQLGIRWIGQVGGQLPFSDELSLLPAAIASGQNSSLSALGGAQIRYHKGDWREIGFRLGFYAHLARNFAENSIHFDAVVAALALELERIQIGLSYDITTSSLSRANNSRGAFELSFIYVQPSRETSRRLQFPRF